MILEVNRKFLLKNSDIKSALEGAGLSFEKIHKSSVFVKRTKIETLFFTKENGNYKKIIINQNGEFDFNSTKDEFANFKGKFPIIKKDIFDFKLNNFPAHLQIYSQNLDKLSILQIDFMRKEEIDNFKIPGFLIDFIQKEIVDNNSYKDSNLALFGAPFIDFDFEKNIQKLEILKNEFKIPRKINLKNNLRLIFLKNYLELKDSLDEFLQEKNRNSLNKLNKISKTSLILFNLFGEFFINKDYNKFKNFFEILEKNTTLLLEKNQIVDFLQGFSQRIDLIQKNSKDFEILKNEFIFKFSHKKIENLFLLWRKFIEDENNYFPSSKEILSIYAYKLRTLILELKRALIFCNFIEANKYGEKISLSLSELSSLFENKNINNFAKKMEKFYSILGLRENLSFLKQKFATIKNSNLDFELRDANFKINKKREKYIENLGQISRYLKIYY